MTGSDNTEIMYCTGAGSKKGRRQISSQDVDGSQNDPAENKEEASAKGIPRRKADPPKKHSVPKATTSIAPHSQPKQPSKQSSDAEAFKGDPAPGLNTAVGRGVRGSNTSATLQSSTSATSEGPRIDADTAVNPGLRRDPRAANSAAARQAGKTLYPPRTEITPLAIPAPRQESRAKPKTSDRNTIDGALEAHPPNFGSRYGSRRDLLVGNTSKGSFTSRKDGATPLNPGTAKEGEGHGQDMPPAANPNPKRDARWGNGSAGKLAEVPDAPRSEIAPPAVPGPRREIRGAGISAREGGGVRGKEAVRGEKGPARELFQSQMTGQNAATKNNLTADTLKMVCLLHLHLWCPSGRRGCALFFFFFNLTHSVINCVI
jgi:hypothetical protein